MSDAMSTPRCWILYSNQIAWKFLTKRLVVYLGIAREFKKLARKYPALTREDRVVLIADLIRSIDTREILDFATDKLGVGMISTSYARAVVDHEEDETFLKEGPTCLENT